MSPLVAAVGLSWLAIVLLALAMAGLLRQLRDVQAALRVARPAATGEPVAPPSVRPASGEELALVLLVAEHCGVCEVVAPAFAAVAARARSGFGFVLLAADAAEADRVGAHTGGAVVRVVGDPVAYHRLDPGWLPALILIDAEGRGLAAEPVGSADAVATTAEQFMGWRPEKVSANAERRS